MNVLLVVAVALSAVTAAAVGLFILHEAGWYPHGKSRGAVSRVTGHESRFERVAVRTHGHQVVHRGTIILRRFGHADVYDLKDPARALMNVIDRYRTAPDRSRLDDLIHVANLVGSTAGDDANLRRLLDEAAELATAPGGGPRHG